MILTGGIAHEKLPSLYSGARVLIFTTKNEPFGMVPVEALACGTPVIASNSGGVRETVQNGFNGILLDRITPQTLGNALNDLLEDPERYAVLQREARHSVERFSWNHHVARFLEILDPIAENLKKLKDSRQDIRAK